MKTITTLCLAVLLTISVHGQDITFSPDYFDIEVATFDAEGKKFGYTMENLSEDTLTWYWSLELAEDFPEEWLVQVCDQRLCYGEGNFKSSNGLPNFLAPNEATDPDKQYIRVRPEGVAGTSFVVLHIYTGEDCTNLIYSTSMSVSSNDIDTSPVSIFPNPTTDYFHLSGDAAVTGVTISSLSGQTIYSSKHAVGLGHDIESIATGMYLIRLYDADQRLIKMQKLYKE